MLFILLFEYAVIFHIPLIIFTITIIFFMLKKDINISPKQDKLWKQILFCNGKISRIIKLDVIVGWITCIILGIIEEIINYGLLGINILIVFLTIQILHYINLITANENREKLYSFFLFQSIPIVGLPLTTICSLSLVIFDFI